MNNELTVYQEIYKDVLDRKILRFPDGFWCCDNVLEVAAQCTKYMIEKVLNWSKEDVCNNLTLDTFKDNKLAGMAARLFNASPYRIISNAYPDEYKPWELKNTPLNFWNKDTSRQALDWLVKELNWTDEDLANKLTLKVLNKYKLRGMSALYFGDSTYKIIEFYRPGKFKPWELKSSPQNYWNRETAKEATKWLIEDKLHYDEIDVVYKLKRNIIKKYGLWGMLKTVYDSSIYKMLQDTYPDKYILSGHHIILNKENDK